LTDRHPITPPPELVEKWHDDWLKAKVKHANFDEYISTKAARWGADQELKTCCEWMLANARFLNAGWIERLRASRRSKPPSLKEQALGALYAIATGADDTREFHQDLETIKTALEQLDD